MVAGLVGGVHERVEERHGDGADPALAELARSLADVVLLEGSEHRPLVIDALAHGQHIAARHERGGGVPVGVEQVGTVRPASAEHVPHPLGCHQSGVGAVALDDRVGRDRGAVLERRELLRGYGCLVECIEDALDELRRRRRGLDGDDFMRLLVVGDEVGEGSADVDGYAELPHAVEYPFAVAGRQREYA